MPYLSVHVLHLLRTNYLKIYYLHLSQMSPLLYHFLNSEFSHKGESIFSCSYHFAVVSGFQEGIYFFTLYLCLLWHKIYSWRTVFHFIYTRDKVPSLHQKQCVSFQQTDWTGCLWMEDTGRWNFMKECNFSEPLIILLLPIPSITAVSIHILSSWPESGENILLHKAATLQFLKPYKSIWWPGNR